MPKPLLALRFLAALTFLSLLFVGGCGYPKHIDPPLYTYDTPALTLLSAQAHARGVEGLLYTVADTHSMEPLLKGGDHLVVLPPSKAPYAGLVAGKPIVYRAAWYLTSPVTHRLVAKDKDGWILSGDNNPRSEPQWRVTEDTYIGTVVGIYRVKP